MLGSFFKQIYLIVIVIVVFTITISVFFVPTFYNEDLYEKLENLEITISSSGFIWPIPRLYKNNIILWEKSFSNSWCIKFS